MHIIIVVVVVGNVIVTTRKKKLNHRRHQRLPPLRVNPKINKESIFKFESVKKK